MPRRWILVRQRGKVPEVPLGCRDAKMPSRPTAAFPESRADRADARGVPVSDAADRFVDERLRKARRAARPCPAVAGARDLEETGLMLAAAAGT